MIPRIGYGGRLTIRLPSEPRIHLARESDTTVWLAVFENGRAVPAAEAVVPLAELSRAIEVLSDGRQSP
jgi:hypothetical protein